MLDKFRDDAGLLLATDEFKYVIRVDQPDTQWTVVRQEPRIEAGFSGDYAYTDVYTVNLVAGNLEVTTDWKDLKQSSGVGNFPLWESNLLRDAAFRALFSDWSNGDFQFP